MNRCKIIGAVAILVVLAAGQVRSQAGIGIYPPQVHQQICRESTYTRYLSVFNSGKDTLTFNAEFTPGPYAWVTAEPVAGQVPSGDTVMIAFHFNSAGLSVENYYAYLQINSNDPQHPDTVVLAMLHVQDLNILIQPENDSICLGCNTTLHTMVFNCSEEYQFIWTSDPPGFNSTEKSPVVSPLVSTTYTVHVTDGGGSAEKSVFIHVQGASAILEEHLGHLRVYPNPAREFFVIDLESGQETEVVIELHDLSGRAVLLNRHHLMNGKNSLKVTLEDVIPGFYFLVIREPANYRIFSGSKILVNP